MGTETSNIFPVTCPWEGNPPITGGFHSQRPLCEALIFSLICARTNGWTNNRDAADLRRHHTHYHVTVMLSSCFRRRNYDVTVMLSSCIRRRHCLLMPLFHWPTMPLRSYGVRKNEQTRSKIAKMVWWNISGATLSRVLRINCASLAHGWRTRGAYGAWMAMPLRMMSHMRTWPLRIHGANGACTAYSRCMHGDQRDSAVYGGRMYSAWAAYMPNL